MGQVYAWNLRPEGPQPIWELEPGPSGGRGFAVQVACRARWPPGVDASIRPLQWTCLSVVMMRGKDCQQDSAGL